MRIQHNIMAMGAYRNYTNNVGAMKKNLEKLSSGYKINRAGDDAAGLAISEKMRAQITGLETASKNAKDGISLVQTAEGALTEVHDMLNRMVELATMSANGTYDNDTDRNQLQKEMDQLNSEINRIADSANFNGIQLLNGDMDADGRVANTETIFSGMKIGNNKMGVAPGKTLANSANVDGGKNDKGGIILSGGYSKDATGKVDRSDNSVRYHQDAKPSSKTSFTVDLDGFNYSASAGTKIENLQFALQGGTANAGMGTGNHLSLDIPAAGGTATALTYDVVAGNEGVTSEDIAAAIEKAINDNGGTVYIKTNTVDTKANDTTANTYVEYSVTRDGDKLTFTMTDDGYDAAYKAYTDHEALDATKQSANANFFQGNFNFSVAYGAANETTTSTDQAVKDAVAARNAFGTAFNDKVLGNTSTCEVNEGTVPGGTIYAQAYIRFGATDGSTVATAGDKNEGMNLATNYIADGKGLKIGDEYYIFAASDQVYNGEYADNVKVVDIRDLVNLNTTEEGNKSQAYYDDLRNALTRLSVAAKDNEMFDVQVEESGAILGINERTTYTGSANLTEKNRGLENAIQTFDSATSKTEVVRKAGQALTLQIGDTAADYNQLKVNIKDVHTSSLGLDSIRIDDQQSALAAIDKIKAAINTVSDIRGTLGATQNRLDHTINNLSVMTENIQDAESTIRDTDVAAEMMEYTKNNILIQSAQAMLAQANQVPQGVLQLLQ